MELSQITQWIGDYGFPMALSWYLLVRMESRLDKLSAIIESLNHTISLQGQNKAG